MPLFWTRSNHISQIKIWRYSAEEEEQFINFLTPAELDAVKDLHPKRRAEILMIRKILHTMVSNAEIIYRDNGEPILVPESKNISITHSFPFAAVALSDLKVGIDLEKVAQKIQHVEHKFILNESMFLPIGSKRLEYLTAIWCIKEALYKMHHSKFWSLKKNYEVYPFDIDAPDLINCRVYSDQYSDHYHARLKKFGDLFFVDIEGRPIVK